MTDLPSGFFCCEYSVEVGEQLFATAPRADVWLALEYTFPWKKDAFAESELTTPVKQQIDAYLAAIPRSRLQLIRQPAGGSTTGAALYIAISGDQQAVLYKIHLNSYDDLLTLDVPGIASGDPTYDHYKIDRPIFLICANGKRDISCAKYGRPVYDSLSKLTGESAWQTTHLGGHRFAATVAILPHGLCFGRVPENQTETLMNEFRQGRICLDLFRGRSCYDEPVQAADYFLREQTNTQGLFELRLVDASNDGSNWLITFESAANGAKYAVALSQYLSEFAIIKNSSDPQGKPGPQFKLKHIKSLSN